MKILKKLLKIIAVLVILLVGAIIALPIIFKDDIVALVKETANESVNAQIDFGEFDLSLLSSFPNFTFEINDVSVINKAPFEGDTLAHLGGLSVELDLGSVIDGNYKVNNFEINTLNANVKVLKDGTANYDIAIEDSSAVEEEIETTEEETPLLASLESFSINNVNITYLDQEGDMKAVVKNFHQSGSLTANGDVITTKIQSAADAISFVMEGDELAKNIRLNSDIQLEMDMAKMHFQFLENKISLNGLNLGIDGSVDMPGDDIAMDLKLSAMNNAFGDVLTLIPAVYKEDISGIDTKGEFSLVAILKGVMTEEDMPAFNVAFDVKNGYIKYPDLPESIQDIQMDLDIDNKDGIIDHTVVDLNRFYFELGGNPVDIKFHVTNVESDPNMRGEIHSKLNLEKLKNAIPMEPGEDYKGSINAHLDFGGKLSAIENEQYDLFKAEGEVIFLDVFYQTPDLPSTLVKTGYLKFSPQNVSVSNFDLLLGKSDIKANGAIDNIFSYVFKDEELKGHFAIASNYFNLNEWMEEDSTSSEVEVVEDEEEEEGVVEVPENIDFELTTSMKKIDYDDMPITDFKGALHVVDQKVEFKDASMHILEGIIGLNGVYNTQDLSKPSAAMELSIQKMDIPTAYNTFGAVKQLAPIAKHATGKFDMNMDFKTVLNDTMEPVYETMNGKGQFQTTNLGISETKIWKGVIGALKLKDPKFEKIKAEDVDVTFYIIDGKCKVNPFTFNMGSIKSKAHGWTSFDGTMEFIFEMKVPSKALGAASNALANQVAGLAGKYGTDVSLPEYLEFDVIASGPLDNPNYKVVPKGGSAGKATDQVKDQVKQKINEEVDKAKAKAQEELDKAKAEAEKKKAELEAKAQEEKAKAEAELEKQKKEAEEKAKAEAEKAKQKAADEAKKKGADLLKKKGLGF